MSGHSSVPLAGGATDADVQATTTLTTMAAEQLDKRASSPCPHDETEPAERDRWRRCLDCFQVVHRSETKHYQRVKEKVL